MTIVYRFLSFFINLFSLLIAVMLVVLLPMAFAAPALLLPVFMLLCVVLYSWFSTKFRKQVLQQQTFAKHSLRDWIRVNGYVALIFSFLNISSSIAIIRNPLAVINSYKEMMQQLGAKMQQTISFENIRTASYIMLAWVLALAIHVLWTFALLKKNEVFFDKAPDTNV